MPGFSAFRGGGGLGGVRPKSRKETAAVRAYAANPLSGGGSTMASPDRVQYWEKTRNLMITMLVIWFVFSFAIHFFVESLNNIVIFGFPLGFYMAAQGSLIVFVVMLFWFARRQNAIDEAHGVAED